MRISLLVLLLTAAMSGTAAAQPASEVGMRLKTGDTVYLLDNASREITGVFGKVTDAQITLMVNGELRDYPLADARKISKRGGDSLWNGMLIGAAVGGTAGGAMQGLSTGIGGAVIYGALGALIDHLVEGRVVLYRAPAGKSVSVGALLTGEQRGLRVAVRF